MFYTKPAVFIATALSLVMMIVNVSPALAQSSLVEALLKKKRVARSELPDFSASSFISLGKASSTVMNGVRVHGDWLITADHKYLLAVSRGNRKIFAIAIYAIPAFKGKIQDLEFSVDNVKIVGVNLVTEKANIYTVYKGGFFDDKGKGTLDRIHDTKFRPLPSWLRR